MTPQLEQLINETFSLIKNPETLAHKQINEIQSAKKVGASIIGHKILETPSLFGLIDKKEACSTSKQFEYHEINSNYVRIDLHKLGLDGWELSALKNNNGDTVYIFKRELQQQPPIDKNSSLEESCNDLIKWNTKYPPGNIYEYGIGNKIESELTAIIEKIKQSLEPK